MTDQQGKSASALAEADIGVLADYGAKATWPAGFSIYERGATADGIFVMLRGLVVLRTRVRAGRGFIPMIVSATETFGGEGLSANRCYVTDARAESETETLHLSNGGFRALMREQPQRAIALIGQVMHAQAHLLDRLRELATMSVEDRLLLTLLRLRETGAFSDAQGNLTLDSGHYRLLCELVGATRESVSLVMNRLVAGGLAERDGGAVVITDLAQLMERAERASKIESENPLLTQREGPEANV